MHDAKPTESPGRYGPHILIMREMGWTWRDLQKAPTDLIDEVLMHIGYERKWKNKRAEIDAAKAKANSGR
jgi:hypothetical protein